MAAVDRNVLRIGSFELLFYPETPPADNGCATEFVSIKNALLQWRVHTPPYTHYPASMNLLVPTYLPAVPNPARWTYTTFSPDDGFTLTGVGDCVELGTFTM